MKWRVEISSMAEDHRLLRDVLEPLSMEIIEEQHSIFLVSSKFDVLDNATEVRALALRTQFIVEEAEAGQPELKIHFKVGNIFEEIADGTLRKHGFTDIVESLSLTTSCSAVAIRADVPEAELQRLEEEKKERDYQILRRRGILLVSSAFNHDHALEIQRLIRGELTTNNMWHIFELIKADEKSAACKLFLDPDEDRFRGSINNYVVLGENARHRIIREPPADPMTLDEMRGYIRSVAMKWLELKAG